MSELLNRFSLEAAKFNRQVFLSLLLIWIAIVACAIVSINSQGFSDRQRRLWIWIIVGVPLLGLLAYLPFSVRREDLPQVFLMKIHKDRALKKAKSAPPLRRPNGLTSPPTRGPGSSHPPAKPCTIFRRLTAAARAAVFSLAILPAMLHAQQPQFRTTRPAPVLDQTTGGNGAGYTGTEGLTNIPPGAFQPEPPVVTPQSLFRNSQFPTVSAATPPLGPEIHSDNVSAEFKLGLPALGGTLPFLGRGFAPENADLKIGPLYFKVLSLEAGVLYSDNINLTPDHQQSGTIAITALTLDVVAQITESLRLATAATFVYFPIEGKVGVAGFGIGDIYELGLAQGPLAHAQVTWDTDIGGWHVVLMDEFLIQQGLFSDSIQSNDVLFQGSRFDEESRAGRYVFVAPQTDVFQNGNNPNNNNRFTNDLAVYSNEISASAERLLPGTVRLQMRVYHDDLWYNQGNRGQPSLREGASVILASERDNMRFKPFFTYEAFRTDQFDGVQSIFRAGISGPITDQLNLFAEVGYYLGGFGDNGLLWDVELRHIAGPYTQEALSYARAFNYFHDEITEGVGYNIQQILGPRLTGSAYVYRLDVSDQIDNDNFTRNEWLTGVSFAWLLGPKTTLRLTGEYASYDPVHTEAWSGRAELGYNITDTLLLRFLYQYQKSTSQEFDQNYTENLFFLSLTKYFE